MYSTESAGGSLAGLLVNSMVASYSNCFFANESVKETTFAINESINFAFDLSFLIS
jgi:hypothetical protein